MTREEIEARILEHAREIRDLIQEYEPGNAYFDLTIMKGDRVSFHNEYWESKQPLDVMSVSLDGVEEDD